MALHVELVSPDRVDFSGEAQMVIARTVDGDAAFMDGHIPLIGTLSAAPLRVISEDGTEIVFAVHQGFIEVSPPGDTGTRVTILSDTSELSSDIDVPRDCRQGGGGSGVGGQCRRRRSLVCASAGIGAHRGRGGERVTAKPSGATPVACR